MPEEPNADARNPDEHEQELIDAARRQVHRQADDSAAPPCAEPSRSGYRANSSSLTFLPTKTAGGAADSAEVSAPIAPNIPDFDLLRLLGRGGFGQVWLARSLTGVVRAVKVLEKSGHTDIEFSGIRNCQVYAQTSPYLIDIHHVGETPTHYYYVMELADSFAAAPTFDVNTYYPRTVRDELDRRGSLPLGEALGIALDVLQGLSHLHKCGLLHRDVKPGNILFAGGRVKLGDIGLVTRSNAAANEAKTPAYAPPEGIRDKSGDLYCLGKTLYELIAGTLPERSSARLSRLDEPRHGAIVKALDVIERACNPNPQKRFRSAIEMAALLEACRTSEAEQAPGAAKARRDSERAWSFRVGLGCWRLRIVLAVSIAVCLVLFAFLGSRIWKQGAVEPLADSIDAAERRPASVASRQDSIPGAVEQDRAHADGIDLLERYPTMLRDRDTVPDKARTWLFTEEDIYQLSEFSLTVGNVLEVVTGEADLGIGHCEDGAVWAVVIPREEGWLMTFGPGDDEDIGHIWLRMHPREITHLIPKNTVRGPGNPKRLPRMRSIAQHKIEGSWQAGGRAMIPAPKDLTVDIDSRNGVRRFFIVDRDAATVEYVQSFENDPVP